jgi:RNA polymerase sigma-70 factor (ECF subfamily)
MAAVPPPGPNDLVDLVTRSVAGEIESLERLTVVIEPEIRRLVSILSDLEDRDDLIQDSMERVLSGLPRFRGEGPFLHWVRQITRWTCADATRRRMRQRRRNEQLAATASRHIDAGEVTELSSLIEQLDADRRDAFIATQVLGLPYAEAAAVLDCPIGTVRSRVARARADLIKALDHTEGALPRRRRA